MTYARRGSRLMLAYRIAGLIPFAGLVIVLLAFVTGAGGLILMAARMYKQPANP